MGLCDRIGFIDSDWLYTMETGTSIAAGYPGVLGDTWATAAAVMIEKFDWK